MQHLAKLMFYLLTLLLALQDQPTFRTDVTLVRVDAEVLQDGRIVEGLGKESFLVTDAGKPQRILYFGHQDEPLDVVLLFDVSAETRLAIQRVADAAHAVLSGLREGDRLAVMASGHTPESCKARLVADLSGDLGTAERRITGEIIQQTSESSPCQLLSGMRGAAQQFIGQPRANRRRAIVVVTDDQGAGTAPRLVHDTVHNLWKADVVVLGVIVHSGNTTVSLGPPHRGARYAAEVTGGDTLNSNDAVEGLREIIRRLRLRYKLRVRNAPRNTRRRKKDTGKAGADYRQTLSARPVTGQTRIHCSEPHSVKRRLPSGSPWVNSGKQSRVILRKHRSSAGRHLRASGTEGQGKLPDSLFFSWKEPGDPRSRSYEKG